MQPNPCTPKHNGVRVLGTTLPPPLVIEWGGEYLVPRPCTPLCLGVQGVGCVRDREDEDQVVKSLSPPWDGVCDLLLILVIKYTAYSSYS